MMWGSLKLTKKLKILFITYTHSNGGGAEAVLTTLVNNLLLREIQKYVLFFFNYYPCI